MSDLPPIEVPRAVVPSRQVVAKARDIVWPVVGLAAVALSGWLLLRQLRHVGWADVTGAFSAIPPEHWLFAGLSTALAYAALAWYDRIALMHLGITLSWPFISAVSFTAYALSHNIGLSMLSGGLVRYRAYSTRGLTVADVGILTAFCAFTFAMGVALLGGVVCLLAPDSMATAFPVSPVVVRLLGCVLTAAVVLYVVASLKGMPPVVLRGIRLRYPRPAIAVRQVIAGPLEVIGAAGIIYWALPTAANPGFLVVLGVFLTSFTAALLSHAPGGLGVLELVFVSAMPGVPPADIIAALLVFRLFYLILPLGAAITAVVLFERSRMAGSRDPGGG